MKNDGARNGDFRDTGQPSALRSRVFGMLVSFLVIPFADGATRVALLGDGKQADQIVALAQAQLSGAGNVEVLDRETIQPILQEQKIALAGLTAEQAIATGKVLKADLLVVIEPAPTAEMPGGVIVFDGETGLRLIDQSLPPGTEASATAVAQSVTLALAKQAIRQTGLIPICLLNVSNADLPRAMDPVCDGIGVLFERTLIDSPSIGVLERRRLDTVNTERSLPTTQADNSLLPAMVLIELQISRGDNGHLKAAAFLSDSRGAPMGRPVVKVEAPGPAALASALAQSVSAELKASPATANGDAVQEARRFAAGAAAMRALNDYSIALRDAEAAMALHDEVAIRAELAMCLQCRAYRLIVGSGVQGISGINGAPASPDDIQKSFDLFESSLDLFFGIDPPAAGWKRTQLDDHGDLYAQYILQRNSYLSKFQYVKLYPAPVQEAGAEVCAAYKSAWKRRLDAWANLATNADAFTNYTSDVQQLIGNSFPLNSLASIANSPAQYVDDVVGVLSPLLLVMNTLHIHDGRFPAIANVGQFRIDMNVGLLEALNDGRSISMRGWTLKDPEAASRIDDFYAKLRDYPHPAVQLYASGRTDAPGAFLQRVRQTIENTRVEPVDDIRDQCYRAALVVMGAGQRANPPPTAEMIARCVALANFMLDRRELDGALFSITDRLRTGSQKDRESGLALLNRAKAVLADPQCKILDSTRAYYEKNLADVSRDVVAQVDEQPATQVAPPWKSVTPLFKRDSGAEIFGVSVIGDSVYVAESIRSENKNDLIQVQRVPIAGGSLQSIGQLFVSPTSQFQPQASGVVCVGTSDIFVRREGTGVIDFPLDRRPPTLLNTDTGLPLTNVRAMACLDGQLYLAMSDGGYICRVDPASGKTEVLASSRREEQISPLDHTPPFDVKWMVADPPRQRVVFFLVDSNRPSKRSGFWELSATGKFKPLILCGVNSYCDWGSLPHGDKVAVYIQSLLGIGLDFDLATDTADVFYAVRPTKIPKGPLGELDATHPPFSGHIPFFPPFVRTGDLLWSGRKFSVISPQSSPTIALPSLDSGRSAADFSATLCMEPVEDGKAIIAGGWFGIWRIDLP
jgi:hypothetical protein